MKPGKITVWLIITGSLLLAAACADYGYQQPYGPAPAPYSTPYYTYPYNPEYYYYPDYYHEQDPDFWRRWEDRQGGG